MSKRLTIADLRRAAARVGGTVEDHCSERRAEYQVLAPDGMLWGTTGDIHALVLGWWANERGGPEWPKEKQEAIADAIERIGEGLCVCDDPECVWCHPEEED